MWQSLLLVLNCIHMACIQSKKAILQVHKELLSLESEYLGNKIWLVYSLLPYKELVDNLRLLWISCKGNKEGWLAKVTNNCYRVLKELLYKPVSVYKRRGENKSMAQISQ